jgi:hypothetical protein
MNCEGKGLDQPDYPKTKEAFEKAIECGCLSEALHGKAHFVLAMMNTHGQGMEAPDYEQARVDFNAYIDGNDVFPERVAYAHARLGIFDHYGQVSQGECPTMKGLLSTLQAP